MRAVTIDSDLATLFTFTPRKPPITPILEVELYTHTSFPVHRAFAAFGNGLLGLGV